MGGWWTACTSRGDQDALVGLKVADLAGVDRYRPDSFVLEGGSIHVTAKAP